MHLQNHNIYHKWNRHINTEFIALSNHSSLFKVIEPIKSQPRLPSPLRKLYFHPKDYGYSCSTLLLHQAGRNRKDLKALSRKLCSKSIWLWSQGNTFWICLHSSEFHHSSVVLWWIDFVLASPNGFIQQVCIVYLLSLVVVWVRGLRGVDFSVPFPQNMLPFPTATRNINFCAAPVRKNPQVKVYMRFFFRMSMKFPLYNSS